MERMCFKEFAHIITEAGRTKSEGYNISLEFQEKPWFQVKSKGLLTGTFPHAHGKSDIFFVLRPSTDWMRHTHTHTHTHTNKEKGIYFTHSLLI
jgi:hypothetical protein